MLLEHQDRPVVIRAQGPSSIAPALPQEIERIATALHREPEAFRIVFDEGYVEAVEQHRVNALALNINKVLTAGFTAVSLLSGSTPPKRTNYETHIRPRAEVQLWKALRQTCDHELGYGDYGVVHPIPPTPKGPIFGRTPTSTTRFRVQRSRSLVRSRGAKDHHHPDRPNATSSR